MKKLSLFLALLMMFSCIGGVFAEGPPSEETEESTTSAADDLQIRFQEADPEATAAEKAFLEQDCGYAVIEADEASGQVKLSYIDGVTPILEVNGLKFKDMNKNGELDVYEDWRLETDTRVADLISQMTPQEEVGLLFCVNTQLVDARKMVREYYLTCQLFNLNGTPITITNTLNNLQASAEAERLGVPMVFTSDREYNSFGGYIDKAHSAFGNAYDPELAYALASFYGKAMAAIGIHVTFEPYANEIGAQYGENPELIGAIIFEEIRGLQENGLSSCTKHWIGRGGDSSFGKARSVAQNFKNWLVGWKAALDAGAEWVMTNCGGTGLDNTVDVKWDKTTMGYLRNVLGFDGVVVTDWWSMGGGPQNPGRMKGITAEGVDLGAQTLAWLYNEALLNGTDMFGSGRITYDYSEWEKSPSANYPGAIIDGLASGEIDKANVDKAATRILRFKFNKGLFENPYRDVAAALELTASAEWAANPTPITTNEELRAARNPYEVELTERLQAKSAVLVKNDNDLLPLAADAKVYIVSSNSSAEAGYKKYIAEKGAVLAETIGEADVVVGDFSSINDAAELFIDDAHDAGKPIVLTLNNTKPTQYTIESADALLYLSYNHRADHGSTEAGFVTTTEPWVYVDLLYGVVEPGGIITKEIARSEFEDAAQWKDLAGDQGASPYVRLMVQATMEDNENSASPSNWGDPLVTYQYGMSYGAQPDFKYSCLILPISQERIEEEGSSPGSINVSIVNTQTAKAGEPFMIYALLRNNGADGITTAQVKANGAVVAEKIMTVEGGSWRVLQMELTLEAGEYTIEVGGLTDTIIIE